MISQDRGAFSKVYIWMCVGTVEIYRKGKVPKEKEPTIFCPGYNSK